MARRIAIVLGCGLLIAACGSSGGPTASANTGYSQALAFAKCMRSRGVSGFPDPGTGGAISLTPDSGFDLAAPAFHAAQQSCQHLLPGGGSLSGPPNPQAKAQMLKMSKCMRAHGISGFPDPHSGSPPVGPSATATSSPPTGSTSGSRSRSTRSRRRSSRPRPRATLGPGDCKRGPLTGPGCCYIRWMRRSVHCEWSRRSSVASRSARPIGA